PRQTESGTRSRRRMGRNSRHHNRPGRRGGAASRRRTGDARGRHPRRGTRAPRRPSHLSRLRFRGENRERVARPPQSEARRRQLMAFLDDVVDMITAQISHIGLSKDGETEYSGGNYAAQPVTYDPSSDGAADIARSEEFEGVPNDGPITHLIWKRSTENWVFRPVDTPRSFNSDGRLDVTSAEVTAAFPEE